jgi:hypothetical protein
MTEAQQQNAGGNVRGGKSEEKHEKAKSYEDYLQVRSLYYCCRSKRRCNENVNLLM